MEATPGSSGRNWLPQLSSIGSCMPVEPPFVRTTKRSASLVFPKVICHNEFGNSVVSIEPWLLKRFFVADLPCEPSSKTECIWVVTTRTLNALYCIQSEWSGVKRSSGQHVSGADPVVLRCSMLCVQSLVSAISSNLLPLPRLACVSVVTYAMPSDFRYVVQYFIVFECSFIS